MRLAPGLREEMLSHALRDLPLEACGLLGGRGEELLLFVPCRNAAKSAQRYAIAPDEILAAERRFAERGIELRGIFRSHPAGPAEPSRTDLGEAVHPSAFYLIAAPLEGQLRGFHIEHARMREIAVEG